MALIDLWEKSREQLKDKHVQQIIAVAGDGRLKDDNEGSKEFHEFLGKIPLDLLIQYADQCLKDSFPDSGLVLQDIVNQVGARLGFHVTEGRYRGSPGHIGFDGLWKLPEGHSIVVEVKTTDAYRIDLNKIAEYRRSLIKDGRLSEAASSILIVVGRKDTGDLEAQIRGSRHAWDVRLISVDSLMRLVLVKQEVDDPAIVQRIYDILIPREFTKLDEIVEIVFSTAEEIKGEEPPVEETKEGARVPKFIPAAFHQSCVDRIETHLSLFFLRKTKSSYSTSDDSTALICCVSKEHVKSEQKWYWFAFHPHQRDFLENHEKSFVAFGCGSDDTIILIPWSEFYPQLNEMNITEKGDKFYWHVHITHRGDGFFLHQKGGADSVDVTKFILSNSEAG
jgi:hypothetical protein